MSQQRIVASRCSASSSAASAATVPCIHRPFEDPPNTSSRHGGPSATAAAFPDSTAALLHRPYGRAKASSADVAGGLMDSLQVPAVDWSNTSAGNSATTSAAAAVGGGGFCLDGVDSSSSDSELQYSKDTCIQNSSADDCSKKRMINIPTSIYLFNSNEVS